MPSYGRKAKAGFIWGVVGRASTELVAIPSAMIVARLLTPYDFGVMALASFFIQIAQRMTNFGFNMALVRLQDPTDLHSSTVFVINLVTGVGMWAVLSASSARFGVFFNSPEAADVIPIATLTFIIGSFGVVPSALLARDLRFKELSLIDSSNAWVQAAASVTLAWLGFGYWSLVYAQLAASIVPTSLKFLVSRWRPSLRFSRKALGDVLSFGTGLHFKRLLDTAAVNIDNLVIGRVLGVATLGIYDKAFTTMNRGVSFLSPGLLVSMSVFSRLQNEPARLRAGYRKLAMGTALLGHPLFAWLIVTAEPLFLILFGEQWLGAVLPFQILCVAAMFRLQGIYISAAIESVGNVWNAVWLQGAFVGLIVVGVVLGRPWGLPGAASGVLAATMTVTTLMGIQLRRVVPLSWGDLIAPQVPALACSIWLTVAAVATDAALAAMWTGSPAALVRLVVLGLTGTASYAIFLLFSPFHGVRLLVSDTVGEFAPRLNPLLRRLGLAREAPIADELS